MIRNDRRIGMRLMAGLASACLLALAACSAGAPETARS
jgi:hypothetical protein